MTDGLTLPRAKTRTRRRRLPRPPKFDRHQKIILALTAACVVFNMLAFLIGDHRLYSLLGVGTGVALTHAIVLDVLRPPFGGFHSFLLACALCAASLVCVALSI